MKTVLIEDASKSPHSWGVSITSANPAVEDYFQCEDEKHALKLSELLDNSKPILPFEIKVKVTIETWNDEWRFEIEDKEDGETLNAGYYPTFGLCVSECSRYLSQLHAAEQNLHTDAGDSAPLETLSTPEHSATSQNLSAPTQRG